MSKIVDIATARRNPKPRPPPPRDLANRAHDAIVGAVITAVVTGLIGFVWAGLISGESRYWQRWVAGDIAKAEAAMRAVPNERARQ